MYHEVPISGKTAVERRTALPELMAIIRDKKAREFDGIVVWKLDRLVRNPGEYHRIMEYLDRHGCEVLSLKDPLTPRKTAADRLISSMLADVGAYERPSLRESDERREVLGLGCDKGVLTAVAVAPISAPGE